MLRNERVVAHNPKGFAEIGSESDILTLFYMWTPCL